MPMKNIYNTPMRRFRCFVFDNPKSVRSSYSVKTKAYSYAFYVYVSACLCPHMSFQQALDIAKIQKIIGSQNNLFQF